MKNLSRWVITALSYFTKKARHSTYFTKKADGFVAQSFWYNDEIDFARLAIGNVYPTYEEAEKREKGRTVDVDLPCPTCGQP